MLKLITLDLDDTLWDVTPVMLRAEKICYDWLCQHVRGFASLYTLESLREYKTHLGECFPAMKWQLTRLRMETLRRVCLQSGHDHDQASALAEQAFEVFYRARSEVTLFDQAEEALSEMARLTPLMALTNGNSDLEQIGIRHRFVEHYSAEGIGAPKPEADMFVAALKAAGVAPEQALHVGDHPWQDIDAARDLGFRTLWVNIKQRPWPDGLQPADAELHHWRELPAALAQIQRR